MCESVRSIVLLPRDLSHHLTQNVIDATNAGIYGDLVQSEVGNAALYRDLVQIECQCWSLPVCLSKMCRPQASLHQNALSAAHLGGVSESVLAKTCWKFFGKCASGKSAEVLRKVCETSRRFPDNFCNDPFLNDPLSEWLTLMVSSKSTGECTWDDWSMSRNTSHGTLHNKYRIRCHCHHKQY